MAVLAWESRTFCIATPIFLSGGRGSGGVAGSGLFLTYFFEKFFFNILLLAKKKSRSRYSSPLLHSLNVTKSSLRCVFLSPGKGVAVLAWESRYKKFATHISVSYGRRSGGVPMSGGFLTFFFEKKFFFIFLY